MFRPADPAIARHPVKNGQLQNPIHVINPVLPLLRWLLPQYVTTTEILGRAMIHVAQNGHSNPILETRDINQVVRAS